MAEVVLTAQEQAELNRAVRLFIACHEVLHGVRAAVFVCPAVHPTRFWFARLGGDDKILVSPVVG